MSAGNQTCLVILGMHRSGTSAVTGVLQLLGIDLGKDLMKAHAENNPKGFFENNKIHYLNEMLLRMLHSSWDEALPLPENWWQQENLMLYRKKAIEILQSEFKGSNFFGLKDPRLCVLLPFWQPIFQELRLTLSYLIVIRHPIEIAASLAYREFFPLEKSVILWMNYMIHAELYSRNHPRFFIGFDEFLKNPKNIIASLSNALSIKFPEHFEDQEENISKFLSPNLKHYDLKNHTKMTVPPFIDAYYHLLQRVASHHDNQRKEVVNIERLRAEYYRTCQEFDAGQAIRNYAEDAKRSPYSGLIPAVKHALLWKFVTLLKKFKHLRHVADVFALFLNSYYEIKFALTTKNRILLHVDAIELLPKSIELTGWAISDHEIERVEVYLDSRFMGEASYGLTRFDIQRTYPSFENSCYSGFHFFAEFTSDSRLTSGRHKITVKTVNTRGQTCKIREHSIL